MSNQALAGFVFHPPPVVARSTNPVVTPIEEVRIGSVVRVASRTMRLSSFPMVSTKNVLRMRNQLQMPRPNTMSMCATAFFDVIPFQSFGRMAYEEVMGQIHSFAGKRMLESAIPPVVDPPEPDSAPIRAARINLRPEALLRCTVIFCGELGMLVRHRKFIPSGVTRPDVSASRSHSILHQDVAY